jgi:hypothetical protein
MRVFIVLLALAYWGLASLAQSHLANGGSYNPPLTTSAFEQEGQVEAASQPACAETQTNDLLIAASFNASTAEERPAAADTLCEE